MNQRERMLAIGVGAIVGLLALYYLYDTIAGKFTDREHQITNLNQTVDKKQLTIDAGARAQRKLKKWAEQSLPSDATRAPSLYQSWLLRLVDDAQLDSAEVQQQSTVGHSGSYEKYGFQVKADSDIAMKQLVQFMYKFYTSNQLHKIKQLLVKPHTDGKALDVTIDIEALLLPTADRTEALASGKLDKLAMGDVKVYDKAIVDRKLFSEYEPPRAQARAEAPRPKTTVDMAKFATVTGIIEADDEPQIWVLVKTTGEMLKLHEGEDFSVGDIKCKVIKIGVRSAVITAEGKTVKVAVGDNLRDATPVQTDDL